LKNKQKNVYNLLQKIHKTFTSKSIIICPSISTNKFGAANLAKQGAVRSKENEGDIKRILKIKQYIYNNDRKSKF